jgi:predicted kinase
MRRFDERQTLDHVAERGGLPPALLAKLVHAILSSHARAPLRHGAPVAESLRCYLQQNQEAFAESRELFPRERVEALTASSQTMLEERSTLFDAVEFDDAIATGDVLYDLAFLLMDLWERGLEVEANVVLNRYLWSSDEAQLRGLAALPLFLSIRAAIRAKVIAASLAHLSGEEREAKATEARRYFAASERFLEPHALRLVAVGGLSGSGKTTLAAAISPHLGGSPGAIHLRSDIERKMRAGVSETHRLPSDSYTEAASDAIYATLRRKAGIALAAGQSVVVDAVHARPAEREGIEATAAAAKALFLGIWLEAPVETLVERVKQRVDDASDATEQVVRQQVRCDLGRISWVCLNTAGNADQRKAEALRILQATTELPRGAVPGIIAPRGPGSAFS